jgi:hypothetical protein
MPSKWTEDDIAKLKRMAGKVPAKDIAAELGRSRGATVVEASKLRLSLRCSKRQQPTGADQGASAPSNP